MAKKSSHSICAWTFNAGKGGFTPGDIRPLWGEDRLDTVGKIRIIKDKIVPRLPGHIQIGFEMHYDYEFNAHNASEIADALLDAKIPLAMATPGAHRYFAFGGICSPDPRERERANEFGRKTLDLVYGPLKKAWSAAVPPCFVIWNGSFGYDVASIGVQRMYVHLKENIAALCRYEKELGGELFWGIEPKPNEGHPAMLLPTVASAITFWKRLAEEHGIDPAKKGVNKEFGHSEMIGLDHVYDTVEEIDNKMLVHMHINSQGYNDGILLGGPGKFDIDNGARINGMNVSIARLIENAGYGRWKGHDMQARAYDTEEQGIERVIRSILSWDACEHAAQSLDESFILKQLENRDTIKVEDCLRQAVASAQDYFNKALKL
jgi:xylose isomerase